ncbi:hypothetical protein AIS11_21190 [Salmonella enterica]|uniref:hypothetical protein n=1 Tax=Salmonella enterica TaxID=28901 RepID=UPI000DEC9C8B|nr:hypothetical protein [Salmonella enterica]EDN4774313.1 hypothetical protein [Salmonella enterica subsp. enterica serovar Gafsa]EEH9713266.1 hypothetical protein [Salmonella enterica subsp. enterica serovar Vancouver]MIG81321.1 hypothetical protein [Salmonella enterica subsp. enterica]HDT2542798.1 hypothetical protein [Klebsiella aerogenes]AXD50743.1 hypothetical protein CHD13_00520 [Salmonella enterica]
MSGSGGGSFGGQFSQEPFELSCEKLTITTQLSSPIPAVVSALKVKDILGIQQINNNGLSLTVALHNGAVAGGIASPQIQRMRDCIALGTTYVAEVIAINGGQVMVKVYAQ